jgi:hypothetical protein
MLNASISHGKICKSAMLMYLSLCAQTHVVLMDDLVPELFL